MKRYRVYQVDAFTREKFRGNPAGVVSNAEGLTENQMQAIAQTLSLDLNQDIDLISME